MRSRRLWITLTLTVLLVLAYTLFGFYGVPRLADHLIRAQVQKLGHRVELGPIHFHPFKLQAQIEQLRLSEADGAPLLGFGTLAVDLELWSSIREGGAVLRYLRLDAPDVALVVEPDGKVNLARLAPPAAAPEPEPEAQAAATIPHLRIDELTVSGGRVGIEDRSRPEPFATELQPVSFTLHDFRTALGHANVYRFSGAASTGERIDWSGEFTVQPLGSNGHFSIQNAQASTATAYLQDMLPLRLLSGVAETAGEYRLSLDPALALEVKLPALTVRDLALAEFGAGEAQPSLSVDEIALADIAVSLAGREASVGGVDIRGLHARLRREADGSLNLAKLVAPSKPAPAAAEKATPPSAKAADATPTPDGAAPSTAPEAAWRATLGGLRVHAAKIEAEDRAVAPAVRLDLAPLDIELGALASDFAEPVTLKTGLGIGGKGRLDGHGTLSLQPLAAKIELDLQRLDLSLLQPYLAPHVGIELKSAQLGVQGTVDWAQEPARLDFDGKAQLADLVLRDPAQKRELLGWRELRIAGIAYAQQRQRLDIARVDLVAPRARVEITPERQVNLATAFAPPGAGQGAAAAAEPAPAPPPAKDAAPALAVKLKTLRVEGGTLDFADRSIEPAFAAAIQKLHGRIDGLSTQPDASAKVELKGQVDEFSPVLIQGELIPFAYDRDTTIALSFRNMDLVRFNPYSGRFAGYNITKGKLSTELKYRIEKRALQAEHQVIVDQLEFGEATGSKDAVPLPIKLAVALLKDRHGTIDLNLPVSGNLDDPTFRVAPLVWKVFVNVLTKAVTAPFAALGAMFGGGEEMQFVAFAPGQATLDAEQAAKLEQLAHALVERPQLKLDVPYALAEQADVDALGRAALAEALAASSDAGDDRLDALADLYKKRLDAWPEYPPDPPEADRAARDAARIAWLEQALLVTLQPDAAALEALAAERARQVQATLLAQPDLAAERIFLTSRQAGALDDDGLVRMELKLQ